MGQCAMICSKGHNYPSDIDVEQLSKTFKSKDPIISKYLNSPLFPKVIFLQKQLKKHLYKTKCLKKSPHFEGNLAKTKTCEESTGTMLRNENVSVNNDKPVSNSKNSLSEVAHTNNNVNTNNFTTNVSAQNNNNNSNKLNANNNVNNNIPLNNNVIQFSTNNINNNNNNIISVSSASNQNVQITENTFIPSSYIIFIPSVPAFFKESPLLISNPFNTSISITKIEADPRSGPFDGVIRSFPLVIEGDYTYQGHWKDGNLYGEGIMTFRSIHKLYGYFKDNIIDGFTKIINEEGDIYQGYFINGKASGYGIINTLKDAIFQGFWLNNNQHGYGYEKWPKGGGYEGEFLEGKKNGIGILSFVQGGSYEGNFENNEMSGLGIISLVDGKKYIGYCKNNKMDGYGVISWPDGKLFEGEFKDDKKEGFGVYYSMRKIYVGMWKNSVLEGNVIIIEGNNIRKQFFENGKPIRTLSQNMPIFFEKYIDNIISYKNEFKDLKRGKF